ncbi:hypothetical protein NEOLEDRAFT_1164612 [Neolentinus lepideus HHB14362 ss-1]|uniref:Zinc finger C2H2 LYAR-type domain-containing protein n=1 Tax=Neolentinus lepideus HHB14362 ss-1 TaxID=1314782 RepID=A0A165PS35_9AGAM|nr:hypothetical protein NEOLEDRAFT_1164612 [Neolentinus lepideus HHB14362 ss-1]
MSGEFGTGCSDAVKKPKLDQHGARCHSSFTCLDCSKTFYKPAEWKGHTSCISEAEKYQKSLYKGPKSKQQQNGRNQGQGKKAVGKYTWGQNGCQGNQRPRCDATGANDTPLGTPVRMSLVSVPPSAPEPAGPSSLKKKSEDVASQETVQEEKKGKKEKKEKKRKSTGVLGSEDACEVRPSKKAKTSKGEATDVAPTTADDQVDGNPDKKKKKEKKKSKNVEETSEVATVNEGEREEGVTGAQPASDAAKDKKEKKHKKKRKSEAVTEQGEVSVEVSVKRDKAEVDGVLASGDGSGGPAGDREKKAKKRKRDELEGVEAAVKPPPEKTKNPKGATNSVDVSQADEEKAAKKDKKDKKKSKRGKVVERRESCV